MAIQADPAADHYFDLVRAFPLRPIRSAADNNMAIATIESLANRRNSWGPADEDYFLVLALLIERYESEIYGEPTIDE